MKSIILIFLLSSFISSCSETSFIINTAKRITNVDEKPKYKVGNPYKINGQWFYPAVDYNYDEVGIASWYGPNFHGKKTANGEIFNQNEISAAHKTLPIPSIVTVTNLENNKILEIRINDRGPFVRGRIIDLSKKAAEVLGVLKNGTAKVRVKINEEKSRKIAMDYENYKSFVTKAGISEKIEKKSIDNEDIKLNNEIIIKSKNLTNSLDNVHKNKKKNSTITNNQILVQVGAFSDIRNANNLVKKLSNFKAYIKREFINDKYFYRVRIGPLSDKSFAEKVIQKLNLEGLINSKIVIESLK